VTQGNALFYGFEAGADYHPWHWLELRGGGDYTYAQNQALEQPIPWIAPLRLRYSAKVVGGNGKWYRAPYISVGASTVTAKAASRVDPNELEPGTPIPGGYTLVNLGAGAQLAVGGQVITVDLDLFNAFNQQYVWFLNRYRNFVEDSRNLGMGRNFMVRVAWTF
jgi:outer membrane receptor protein involved in Fe transport